MDFCLEGMDNFASISKANKGLFVNAVTEMAQDLNWFNVKKLKCALCGTSGHNFDDCPEVTQSDLKGFYIHLQLLNNKLMPGLKKLYPKSVDCNDI